MKRRYAKFTQYPLLTDEAIQLKREIDSLENELSLLWDRSIKKENHLVSSSEYEL